jgi:hypothetical protein
VKHFDENPSIAAISDHFQKIGSHWRVPDRGFFAEPVLSEVEGL